MRFKSIIKICTVLIIFLTITSSVSANSNLLSNNLLKISKENNEYDLLIISPKSFMLAFKILAQHKTKHNIETKIVDVKNIYGDNENLGRDNQEKIKYYIKQEIEDHNISYVILAGSFKHIPIRYCHNVDRHSNMEELKFISDLYYADIFDKNGNFSSWDTNQNGIYGEWNGSLAEDKDIDLKPDVSVGRLACSNLFEVFFLVRKIIKYEEETFGQTWFNKIIGVGGDSYTEYEGYEGEINTQNAMNNLPGFNHVKLWASNGNLTGERSVIKEINKGCGFIYFDGHGLPNMWATYPPDDNKTMIHGLKNLNMIFLRNKNKLPICIVSACHNCEFDVKPLRILKDPFYQFTWVKECWGWHLTSKFNGGSIATIGNTGLGYSKEDKQSKEGADSYLDPQFFWEYGMNGTEILGKAWQNAINTYLNEFPIDWDTPSGSDSSIDAKTVQQWVLLGDPSLKIGGYKKNSSNI